MTDRSIGHDDRGRGAGTLWCACALPPPTNGQANCNLAMLDRLSHTARVRHVELGKGLLSKMVRALANAVLFAVSGHRDDVVYLSMPGQNGAWLATPLVLTARLRGAQTWFHYHSFRPIRLAPYPAIRACVALAGARQQHIVLSNGMKEQFAAAYLGHGRGTAHVLSNTFLFPPVERAALPRPQRPPTLGHLSVLTKEKGVLYLLEVFERCRRKVPDLRLIIAGPTRDTALRQAIEDAVRRYEGGVEWRGPVHDAQKDRFYADIDLFLLPTTLIDEAEPLVMFEAYAAAVDVAASAAGCIPERIRTPERLLSLDPVRDAPLIEAAVTCDEGEWADLRENCRAHARAATEAARARSRETFERLARAAGPAAVKISGDRIGE